MAHDGKVRCNTVEYTASFLHCDSLYFLWHETNSNIKMFTQSVSNYAIQSVNRSVSQLVRQSLAVGQSVSQSVSQSVIGSHSFIRSFVRSFVLSFVRSFIKPVSSVS